AAGRHSAVLFASRGQAALVPVQLSARSQTPAERRSRARVLVVAGSAVEERGVARAGAVRAGVVGRAAVAVVAHGAVRLEAVGRARRARRVARDAHIAVMRTVQRCRLGAAWRMAGAVRVTPAAASRPAGASPSADVTSPRLLAGQPPPPLVGAVRWRVPDAAAHREAGRWHRSWTRRPPKTDALRVGQRHRRAIVTRSNLSRLGRVKYALALLAALATSGALRAHAAGGSCVIGYPFKSSDPRTDVDFNESEVLRAFSPERTV